MKPALFSPPLKTREPFPRTKSSSFCKTWRGYLSASTRRAAVAFVDQLPDRAPAQRHPFRSIPDPGPRFERLRRISVLPERRQPRHGFPPPDDDDLLAALDPIEQATKGVFGRGGSNLCHPRLLMSWTVGGRGRKARKAANDRAHGRAAPVNRHHLAFGA